MDRAAFDARVARLEVFARRNWAAYRTLLVALALLGYAYLLIVAGLLAAVGLLLLLAILRGGGILAVKVAIPALALAALVARAMWVRFEPPRGRPIHRRDAPRLFAMLDELRAALRTPPFHRVLVSADFNAFVAETPRLGIFGWPTHHLVVGAPLMHALSPGQFRAVLAHELGHRSGRHGRIGAWIYRVRASWARLLQELEQRRHGAAVLFTGFFRWYAPTFAAWSFVEARKREYEADQAAAELAGADALSEALVAIEVGARYYEQDLWPSVERLARRQLEPPHDVHADFARRVAQGPPPELSARYLVAALSRTTDTADTHPSLSDRLAALGRPAPAAAPFAPPAPPAPPATTAAAELLGPLAPRVLADFDAEWREAVGPTWRDRHRQLAGARRRLDELSAAAAGRDLEAGERRERALLADELEEPEVALPLIAGAAAAAPADAELRFVHGRALLVRGDAAGAPLIAAAMADDPRLTLAGCELLIGHHLARGETDAVETYRRRATEEQELRLNAQAERTGFGPNDATLPHGLPDEAVAEVAAALAAEPAVKQAWLVRKAVRFVPEEPFYVLAVEARIPWYTTSRQRRVSAIADRLAQTVVVPGQAWILVAEPGRDSSIKRIMRSQPAALVYRRARGRGRGAAA